MPVTQDARTVRDNLHGKVGSDQFCALPQNVKKILAQISPQVKKNDPTKALAERFVKDVYIQGKDVCDKAKLQENWRSRLPTMEQVGRLTESVMINEHQTGRLQITGKDGVDFDGLHEMVMGNINRKYKKGTRLTEVFSKIKRGDRLQEDAIPAIGASQYGRYLDTAMRIGTIELCGSVDVAPILSLLGTVQVDCGTQTLVTDLVPARVYEELHPMAEGQQTPFFGVERPAEIGMPERDLIKFAYAINRQSVCKGLDDALRRVMVAGAKQIERYWAPQVVQLIFGMFAAAADNRWAYRLNGQKWKTEYQEPAEVDEGSVPYVNLLYNNQDLSRADDSIFILIEQMMREMSDYRTGDPIECIQGQLDIIATGFKQVEDMMYALGMRTFSKAHGGVSNTVVEYNAAARGRWNVAGAFDSPWIERYLDEFYKVQTAYTRAQRAEAIQRSFVAGNVSASMVIQEEWGQEELDMPTDWADFDREIIWGRKFMKKSGLGTVQPQARFLVKGLPDGEAVPAPDPNPIGPI